ncbi:Uncharacterised protein [Vibrio cholerae]|nr:Uncharacterised protein [Vibrio cholerae]
MNSAPDLSNVWISIMSARVISMLVKRPNRAQSR